MTSAQALVIFLLNFRLEVWTEGVKWLEPEWLSMIGHYFVELTQQQQNWVFLKLYSDWMSHHHSPNKLKIWEPLSLRAWHKLTSFNFVLLILPWATGFISFSKVSSLGFFCPPCPVFSICKELIIFRKIHNQIFLQQIWGWLC